MNRVTTLALVLVTLPALGAVDESRARIGVQGGMSLSSANVSTFSAGDANRTGFTAGALVEAPIVPHAIFLQPELNFTQRGGSTAELASTRLNYVELPVYLKIRFDLGGVRPYVLGGPRGGYLVNATTSGASAPGFSRWDWGADAGAGVGFAFSENTSLFVTAKYSFGLNNVRSGPGDWKSNGVTLTGGLLF